MIVNFKKAFPDVKSPTASYERAAAYDLYAHSLTMTERYIEYDTGIITELPVNSIGLMASRSSISNYDLILANGIGILDEDYKGTLKFRFRIFSSPQGVPKIYKVGDKIGQLFVMKRDPVSMIEVKNISETLRGSGGFGSSGT